MTDRSDSIAPSRPPVTGTPRVLIISRLYPPSLNSEAIVTGKLVAALRAHGMRVDVVAGPPLDDAADAGCWEDALPRPHVVGRSPHRPIRWIGHARALARHGGWLDATGWVVEAERQALAMIARQGCDCIISRALPEDSAIVGYRLWEKTGLPWIACFGDPPLGLAPLPYLRGRRLWHGGPALRWLRRALPHAFRVVLPCRQLADYFQDTLGIPIAHNVAVVPHVGWRAPAASDLGPSSGPVRIMHLGLLGAERPPADCLEGLDRTLRRRSAGRLVEVSFVGPESRAMQAYLRDRSLAFQVKLMPPVTYEDSLRLMQLADALLLIEAPLERGIFLPAKLCDYAMSERPVLMFSPERGAVADAVGGFAHPGFMGQTAAGAASAFTRLLAALETGAPMKDFTVPGDDYRPEVVATRFGAMIEACTSR